MKTQSILPGLLTLTEAATVIGVSHSQVSRYTTDGLIPTIDLGHQKLIREADAKNFKRPPRGNPSFLAKKGNSKKSRK